VHAQILQFPTPALTNLISSFHNKPMGKSYPHLLQFLQPQVTAPDKHHPKYFKMKQNENQNALKGNITKF